MQKFIGNKVIKATPMTRWEYNEFRGWDLPPNENGDDEGYLIENLDTGVQANTKTHDGYISWSPVDVFDREYRPTTAMSFGDALVMLKEGHRVSRAGWNGKGMWIVLMTGMNLPPYNTQGTEKKVNDRTAKWIGEDTPLETLPYIAMWTVNAEGRRAWLPGWVASQTDMLAEDWTLIG